MVANRDEDALRVLDVSKKRDRRAGDALESLKMRIGLLCERASRRWRERSGTETREQMKTREQNAAAEKLIRKAKSRAAKKAFSGKTFIVSIRTSICKNGVQVDVFDLEEQASGGEKVEKFNGTARFAINDIIAKLEL